MIQLMFEDMNRRNILIRVDGNDILIATPETSGGGNVRFYPIKQSFQYNRVIKTYPELKESSSWRDKMDAIFKKKLNEFKTETDKAKYVIKEFEQQGCICTHYEVKGHRMRRYGGDIR